MPDNPAAHNGRLFMPSLRAPTAKRAVGSAVLPDNVDLDTVTVSGMYRLAGMEPAWQMYSQLLVVHGGADTISQVIFAFLGGGVYVRTGNPTQVGGPGVWRDWKQLAVCTAPEVHDLPLYNGYTNLGCKYFRTQENVVSFAGEVMRTSGFRADETFAVLPEGFRPDHTIVVPALLYPSYTPTTIIIKSNGEICETRTASDKSLYMQATFVAG